MYIHHKLTQSDNRPIHKGYTLPNMTAPQEPPSTIETKSTIPEKCIIDVEWKAVKAPPIIIEAIDDGISAGKCTIDESLYMSEHPDWYHTGYSHIDIIDARTKEVLYQMDFPVVPNITVTITNVSDDVCVYTPPGVVDTLCLQPIGAYVPPNGNIKDIVQAYAYVTKDRGESVAVIETLTTLKAKGVLPPEPYQKGKAHFVFSEAASAQILSSKILTQPIKLPYKGVLMPFLATKITQNQIHFDLL